MNIKELAIKPQGSDTVIKPQTIPTAGPRGFGPYVVIEQDHGTIEGHTP